MTKNATAAAVPRNNTPIKGETRLSREKLACGRAGDGTQPGTQDPRLMDAILGKPAGMLLLGRNAVP
ncbi:hypothetical protein GCM10009530_37280 [Microbispora corallina]|uniref:Uncharacterized protein n=1 Tax=Microbispora corallina TaxID=83302 RepID=A0ABQ4G284_9ACTN|nr:hypothetical protein Mco01_41770 [Microbispora corallina]